ncbi:MAG: hypothetical protein JWM59_657 [Verrucomicrobiales bacterium]|nr:hypothetical protein [Verrucomicrobiales bacterium]
MAQAAIQAITTDEAAAEALPLVRLCLDFDDPEQARILRDLIRPLAAKKHWAYTADWLIFIEASLSLRTGETMDATASLPLINDAQLKAKLTNQQIGVFLARGRRADLKKLMAKTPSATLLSLFCLSSSIPAWRALGQEEEAGTGMERIHSHFRRYLGMIWSIRDVPSTIDLLEGMAMLNDPSVIPPGFEDELGRWVAEPKDLDHCPIYDSLCARGLGNLCRSERGNHQKSPHCLFQVFPRRQSVR